MAASGSLRTLRRLAALHGVIKRGLIKAAGHERVSGLKS
jgi:hypothetical protein